MLLKYIAHLRTVKQGNANDTRLYVAQWYTLAPRMGGQTMNRARGIATAKDIKAVCSSGMASANLVLSRYLVRKGRPGPRGGVAGVLGAVLGRPFERRPQLAALGRFGLAGGHLVAGPLARGVAVAVVVHEGGDRVVGGARLVPVAVRRARHRGLVRVEGRRRGARPAAPAAPPLQLGQRVAGVRLVVRLVVALLLGPRGNLLRQRGRLGVRSDVLPAVEPVDRDDARHAFEHAHGGERRDERGRRRPRARGRERAVGRVGRAQHGEGRRRLGAARLARGPRERGEALARVERVLGPRAAQRRRQRAVARVGGAQDLQVLGALVAARCLPLADGTEALERVVRHLRAVGPRQVGRERAEAGVGGAQECQVLDALGAARQAAAERGVALERVVRHLGAVGPRQVGRERAVARVGLAQVLEVLGGLEAARRLDELRRRLGAEEELAEAAVLGAHAGFEHEQVLARQRLRAEEAVLGAHEEVCGARVVGGDAPRQREVALRRGGRGVRAATPLEKRALLIERTELLGDSPHRRARGRALLHLALLAVGKLEVAEVGKALRREDAVGAGLARQFVGNQCARVSLDLR